MLTSARLISNVSVVKTVAIVAVT